MIKQNDPRLNSKIQAYGCNKLSHLAMIRHNWLPEEVEIIYQQALRQGIINENCTVHQPQKLLAMAGSSIRQIGGIDLITGEKWGVDNDDPRVKYRMARWSQKESTHEHFTLVDKNYHDIYDPYDPSIATYELIKDKIIGVQYYG